MSLRERADSRLDDTLERGVVRDPRDSYRERLRSLRERDQVAFTEARRYYEEVLVPQAASADSDPIQAWFDFGLKMVELEGGAGAGELLVIDSTGLARDFTPPLPVDELVIYLPGEMSVAAFALNTPITLSPAQEATYALLIERRLQLASN